MKHGCSMSVVIVTQFILNGQIYAFSRGMELYYRHITSTILKRNTSEYPEKFNTTHPQDLIKEV